MQAIMEFRAVGYKGKVYNGGFFTDNGKVGIINCRDENMQINRIYYELEEINRKLRNLNNRLHRIELFLGLSIDDNKGDK